VTVSGPPTRFGTSAESTAYFVASEALANVAKYAEASHVSVRVEVSDGAVMLEVADDGIGGAHMGPGSGLTGLADRVEAIGGRFALSSPTNQGTTIRVELPWERPEHGAQNAR
jgi:signal transduction histidine kinase